MRSLLACLALSTAALTGTSALVAQPQKLSLPEPAAKPVFLRVAPGYAYMAGDPNGLSVELQHGEGMWLVYYSARPGDYVGDPKGAAPGKAEVLVESSTTPGFLKVLGAMPMTPNAKGHIKVIADAGPLQLDAAPGRSQTFYLRVRNNLGVTNIVSVKVSRPTPLKR